MEHTEPKQAMKELTMMLIYLSRFCEREKFAEAKHFYAWKGYDFDVLDGLDDEDLIRQGSRRSKSVYLTETGKEYARSLLEKYGDADDSVSADKRTEGGCKTGKRNRGGSHAHKRFGAGNPFCGS